MGKESAEEAIYSDVLQAMKNKKPNTLIHQLRLFLDPDGVIQCAGQFPVPTDKAKSSTVLTPFPMLLPMGETYSKLIVEQVHEHIMHGRVNSTLY